MSATTVIGSSLPPQVEGQLRCFLSVKTKNLDWNIPQPPKDVQVCIHWWGDNSEGNLIRFVPKFLSPITIVDIYYQILLSKKSKYICPRHVFKYQKE